jgi:hypothetical protein
MAKKEGASAPENVIACHLLTAPHQLKLDIL